VQGGTLLQNAQQQLLEANVVPQQHAEGPNSTTVARTRFYTFSPSPEHALARPALPLGNSAGSGPGQVT
jgi:hypothetical protein